MRSLFGKIGTVMIVLAWFMPLALAQGTSGSIIGIVYDSSKAVLPGVTVTAADEGTGQTRSAVTDDQGRYALAQMRIGTYKIEAELPGFETATHRASLTLEGNVVVDFTLGIEGSATEVVVTSEAPMVDTTSSTVKSLVDAQQIRDLPLNGRSFTDLATMQAGVVEDYFASGTQIGLEGKKLSIAGARSRQSLFQLDGTDMRNVKGGSPGSLAGVQLGVDTVQEFSVSTAVASAEYGNFTGGVVNAVTKSGTNEVHGSLFYFLRNSALDARNFFDRDPSNPLQRSNPPPFKRNQYGFTLGGPIKRNTLFIFGSFESINDRFTSTGIDVVPSLAARTGLIPNQGQFAVSPIVRPILDAWPVPNGASRSDGTADYIFSSRRVLDGRYAVTRIDWQISDRDTVAGRYMFDGATSDQPINIDVIYEDSLSRNNFTVLEWRRIISPSLINEAKVSLNRSRLRQNFVERKPLPAVMQFNPLAFNFNGDPWRGVISVAGVSALGAGSSMAQQHTLNRFQFINNLSYTTGAHSLKVGVSLQRLQLNNLAAGFINGTYSFDSLREFITNSPPRLFDGTVTGFNPLGLRHTVGGFYIQDDWRASSTLTLNLGLRYEPYTRPSEVKGRLGNLRSANDTQFTVGNPLFTVNPSWKNFAPRAGFAWDPFGDGKTSIRAGYGLFYELIGTQHFWSMPHRNPPLIIGITRNRPPFPNPQEGLSQADLAGGVGGLLSPWIMSDEIEQGGMHQYQVSIQRELSSSLALNAAYTGSQGYNLGHLMDRNTAIPQKDAQGGYPFYPVGSQRRNPQFSRTRDTAWDGSSWYNSLGLTLRKQFNQGYSFQTSYTFGKSMDNASATSTGEGRSAPNGLSSFTEDVDFDRGLSDFDVRHRLSVNGSWDLPFGSGRAVGSGWTGVRQQVLGGWTANSILTMATGAKATSRINFNWSRSQQLADVPDRVSLIPGGNNNPVLSDGRDPNRYFDGNQFILGPAGYFGNLGRNTIELPGVLMFDLSVLKDFKFGEEKYVQFRAEIFNALNRANFGVPNTSPILNATGARSSTVGRITTTTTTARQIQFALRIQF